MGDIMLMLCCSCEVLCCGGTGQCEPEWVTDKKELTDNNK